VSRFGRNDVRRTTPQLDTEKKKKQIRFKDGTGKALAWQIDDGFAGLLRWRDI